MESLPTVSNSKALLAQQLRERRLQIGFTQAGLSNRSGVSLPTLRKFEQKGLISLESFLKLSMVLGILNKIVEATKPGDETFTSIDDVLRAEAESKRQKRQRGWCT